MRELAVKATIRTREQEIPIEALIDSGCTHTCIAKRTVIRENLPMKKLKHPYNVFNADGTINKDGKVSETVDLEVEVGGHKENVEARVVQLEDWAEMFMGYDWLVQHNPEINWQDGTIRFTRCPTECAIPHQDIRFEPRI